MVTNDAVVGALKSVFDPEIPVNIYDLGLIYDIKVDGGVVHIRMSLTSKHCPAAQSIPNTIELKVNELEGVEKTQVEVVWDPPWSQDRISAEGKKVLGI
jgi:FeS assembly SUF system protein